MPQVNPEVFHGKLLPLNTCSPCTCADIPRFVWAAKVYDITRLIPYGRVTSYGHIARLTGHPAHSRLVGSALKFLQDPDVPWHRVISSSGAIADRGDGGEAAARQAHRLTQEGVTIIHGRGEGITVDFAHPNPNAKYRINMTLFGWFPDQVHLQGYDEPNDEQIQDSDSDSDLTEPSDDE
ncbi:6-O-methylguanine-DNA methyltransferase MGMT/MGT1 [Moesziomyces antarcticus T-34]|uniref:6-O-methylguanine-DNA methyltransferase MGMT/MGT1 n=1 Tax=Pseudozyma antarctica (strain T-34) TaxID=1151754 RepID=M9LY70_PSEA3|nr:6-O-methylguanine-DNA methyltransferase MGMT/MGT1 [Moesziomyces antarcticus T-34]